MRVMIHGVPPWAPSGYGVQGALLARGLRDAGHDVTYSAYGGFIREELWDDEHGEYGIPVLACGGTSKGVGRIAHNYRRANADVMITVCDLWPLDAREFEDLNVVSWLPVDCDPLGMPDQIQLRSARELCRSFTPVAMSGHGQRMLDAHGVSSTHLIPHMIAPEYKTGDRWSWRKENGIPDSEFLVSTVGVNGDYPCRKGFPELLAAWQVFSGRHPDARLYMHALISPGVEGVDLMQIAKSLDLGRTVGFPDQLKRMSDQLGPEYMAGMYRASDVFVMPSLGEGFSVPVIEAMACGTPVIASSNSALADRDCWEYVATQPSWNKLHNAWWSVPIIASLVEGLERAYREARDPLVRRAVKQSAAPYRPEVVMPMWLDLLSKLA
jgi:glycosyltransferase involved in cell wall biosynthesis